MAKRVNVLRLLRQWMKSKNLKRLVEEARKEGHEEGRIISLQKRAQEGDIDAIVEIENILIKKVFDFDEEEDEEYDEEYDEEEDE